MAPPARLETCLRPFVSAERDICRAQYQCVHTNGRGKRGSQRNICYMVVVTRGRVVVECDLGVSVPAVGTLPVLTY